MVKAPMFYVVSGSTVKKVIDDQRSQVFKAVEAPAACGGSINKP